MGIYASSVAMVSHLDGHSLPVKTNATPRFMCNISESMVFIFLGHFRENVLILQVDTVIEKLNLKKCADTVVGSPGLVRGISGGERKRTNVALSLLGNPALLLLDEPTSGLDSKMSDSLMKDVKQITEQGCTVVATIHQPSEAVFCRFDKVLLLETGRVAW